MKKLILLLSSILLSSCTPETELKEKQSILVLGNSITAHEPLGEWKGNWGMAATSPDKDFCGILSQTFDLDKKTIAVWENNFNCSEEYYKFISDKQYDYVIFKIGENVSNTEDFKLEFQKLIDLYKNYGENLVLVTTIWKDYKFNEDNIPQEIESKRDKIIRELALENNLILVDLSEMKENPKNYAWGEYEDGAIASHPSDKCMKFIADRILENLLK